MIWISDKNAPLLEPLKKTYEIEWQKITFESWKIWLLIDWAVTISDENDNILFVTAWFKQDWLNEKTDFFPLVVDFQEKYYATGKIWGNKFQKREWRPTDDATLSARLIDRPIRPMFPKGIVNDTQVIVTVLSASWERELGFWWIVWASLTLMMAWTPFEWPVWACRLALMADWKYIFNPSVEEEKSSILNLLTAGTSDAITMVEAAAKEASDKQMLDALAKSHEIIKKIIEAEKDYLALYKDKYWIPEPKVVYNLPNADIYSEIKEFLTEEKLEVLYDKGKKEFQKELDNLTDLTKEYLLWVWYNFEDENQEKYLDENSIWEFVYKRVKEVMRKNILQNERRLDWRKLDEVRTVSWEVSLLPRTHGSALFRRGLTQALSVTTLWGPDDTQVLDGMMPETEKIYMHHYNFPPYSVWEVRMLRWVWRREIWHWALAEKALVAVLPSLEEFPYTIRVVSEIMTCNGSSSMASICGSTMSLMNAWVPIKAPVAWVAMWMIYDEETWNYKILSDIQAQEDFLWDMDFKVWRTKNWITAMQLDVKIKWLKLEVFENTFAQSKWAIDYILEEMLKVQPKVAESLSPYAPLILKISIPVDKISAVIWRGWENVQKMEKDYSVSISIADDWLTTITASSQENWDIVIAKIKEIIWEPEVWYKWTWIVSKIIDWVWAIVDFKWKSWMIHISKLSYKRIAKVEDLLKVGDSVDFEILEIDNVKWKIWLKRVLSEAEKKELEELKKQKEAELLKKVEAENKEKTES